MLIEKYLFDGVKAHTEAVAPLIVTNENARKAIFTKLHRSGGVGESGHGNRRMVRRGLMRRGNSFVGYRQCQRVIVKIRYVKHKPGKTGAGGGAAALRDHLRYISRSGAGHDGVQASLFNGGEGDLGRKDFLKLCEQDRHHFRFIISPENGHQIDDFQGYVRQVMKLAEKDLQTGLTWVSAVHYDTDDVHAHVIVRGKNDRGEDLVIGQDYIKQGFRHRAQEVATKLLGERTLDEIQKSLSKEVESLRVTSLDRFIERQLAEDRKIDVRKQINFGKSVHYEGLIKGRLRFLGQAGLALEQPPGVYRLKEDYTETLQEIAAKNEVVKRLYNKVNVGMENISIYSMKSGTGPTVEGRVVAKGFHDEISDRHYVVVKEMSGDLHYVPVGTFKRYDDLQEGSLVRVSAGEQGTGKADYNIATIAEQNNGIYDPALHKAHIERHQKYIKPEERARYLEAHSVRLGTLEKNNIVEPLGEGRYKVPTDVVVRGEEINRQIAEKERKRFYPRLSILSAAPPEKETEARRKTWLDKELHRLGNGKGASIRHDEDTRTALEQRKVWLVAHELALIQSNGEFALRDHTLNKLDKMEVYGAGNKLAEKLGLTFSDVQVKPDTVMSFEGFVKLETGIWAAVSRGKALQLTHQTQEPKLERGEQVIFEKGEGVSLEVRSVAKQRTLNTGKEQDRGL